MSFSPSHFMLVARKMMGRDSKVNDDLDELRFKATFGVSTTVCAKVWGLVDPKNTMDNKPSPSHLLMALMFLKLYCSENVHSTIAGVDEKTFRKWAWLFVEAISYLEPEVVSKNPTFL